MEQYVQDNTGQTDHRHLSWREWILRDRVLVPLLFLAGLTFGLVYLFQYYPPDWYLNRSTTGSRSFVTATMLGLGHGFAQPAVISPELDAFLSQQRMTIGPEAVPEGTTFTGPNAWEGRHRYLLSFVGLVWRVTGPSWPVLKVLLALAFAVVLVLAYALLRQGMGPTLSFLLAVAYVATPGWHLEISSVRDFMKVPFLLVVFVLLAYLLRTRPKATRLFGCALALGAVVGIGLGFRQDLIVCVPPALLVLAVPEGRPWRRALIERSVAVALFLGAFLLVSAPVRDAYDNSGAPFHDAMMGLTPRNLDNVGLDRGFYDRFPANFDNLVHAAELGYAQRMLPNQTPMRYDDADAEAVARHMLITMVLRFPADFLARSYAAVLWVLEGGCPQHSYAIDSVLTRPFNRWVMVPVALMVFVILLMHRVRVGVLALLLFLYFSVYVTVQFEYRHVYHLAIVALWILGFLAQWLVRARRAPGGIAGMLRAVDQRRLRFALVAAAAIPLGAAVLLGGARAYQAQAAEHWLRPYEQATLTPLHTEPCISQGWTFFRATDFSMIDQLGTGWFYGESYLAADIGGAPRMRPFYLVYRRSPDSGINFNQCLFSPVMPEGRDGDMRVFFPVYIAGDRQDMIQMEFAGVAMKEEDASAFQGLYRVENTGDFDLLPVLWLPKDRDQFVPYQTLRQPRVIDEPWLDPRDLDCPGTTLKSHILIPPSLPGPSS